MLSFFLKLACARFLGPQRVRPHGGGPVSWEGACLSLLERPGFVPSRARPTQTVHAGFQGRGEKLGFLALVVRPFLKPCCWSLSTPVCVLSPLPSFLIVCSSHPGVSESPGHQALATLHICLGRPYVDCVTQVSSEAWAQASLEVDERARTAWGDLAGHVCRVFAGFVLILVHYENCFVNDKS